MCLFPVKLCAAVLMDTTHIEYSLDGVTNLLQRSTVGRNQPSFILPVFFFLFSL